MNEAIRRAIRNCNQSVVRNANLLNGVAAHLIFTVPISLLYNPIEEQIPDRFRTETLPMDPVFPQRGRSAK